jgi:hypothetical protein
MIESCLDWNIETGTTNDLASLQFVTKKEGDFAGGSLIFPVISNLLYLSRFCDQPMQINS